MMLLSMAYPVELDCLPHGVVAELSPKGASPSPEREKYLAFTQEQANAIVSFLRFEELREKLDSSEPGWPDEAILSVPTSRPIERALTFWSKRASHDG
jgi:hypothetical protein